MTPDRLAGYRRQARRLIAETIREHYLYGSGQKDRLELEPIFQRHAELFTREQVEALRAARDGAPEATGGEGLRRLHGFALDQHLQSRVRALAEELAARQARAVVRWRGQEIPYPQVPTLLRGLPTREERAELHAARGAVERELTPLRARIWQDAWGTLRGLGYASYREAAEETTGMPLRGLAAEMAQLLEDTRPLLEGPLDEFCRARTGVGLAQCSRADAPFLFRPADGDPRFAAARVLERVEAWTGEAGVPLRGTPAIRLDDVPRPRKCDRAFCAPVEPGREVYVNVKPLGGVADLAVLLHELGHAYHYAFANPALEVEWLHLGEPSQSEIFAFLFNQLVESVAFLDRFFGAGNAAEIRGQQMMGRIWGVRRMAAKLLYEMRLHEAGTLEGMDRAYAETLTRHLGMRHDPEEYLADLDPWFYAAGYLRAWMGEAQLRAHLETAHGEGWFTHPAAVETLKRLWGWGKKYRPEALLATLGIVGPDPAALVGDFATLASPR